MNWWILECEGTARELYAIEAESEEEVKQIFEDGRSGPPYMTECSTEPVAVYLDE